MRTDELALDYIDRAGLTLEEARSAFEKEVYSLAIRRAQETCELSLKGALRYLAIEYPRDHDVSDVLLRLKEIRTGVHGRRFKRSGKEKRSGILWD